MDIKDVDFSQMEFNGQRIVAAYYNKKIDHKVVCELKNGYYALYSIGSTSEWWSKDFVEKQKLITGGWSDVLKENCQIYLIEKVGAVELECICPIRDLWNGGCPSSKGSKCRSKK